MMKPMNSLIAETDKMKVQIFSTDYVDYFTKLKNNIEIIVEQITKFGNVLDHINIFTLSDDYPVTIEILTKDVPKYPFTITRDYSNFKKSHEYSENELVSATEQLSNTNKDNKDYCKELERIIEEIKDFKAKSAAELKVLKTTMSSGDVILGIDGLKVNNWQSPVIILLQKLGENHA